MSTSPSENSLPLREADFATLAEALDYAAQGATGLDFYDARGRLLESLPYRELRDRAMAMARRLLGSGLSRGDRIAIVAQKNAEFVSLFFGCQYAGLTPVTLPSALNLGSGDIYVAKLRALLEASRPTAAFAPESLFRFLEQAAHGIEDLRTGLLDDVSAAEEADVELHPSQPDDLAYIQFTSGSTASPRGVVVTEASLMSNLRGIVKHGLAVRPDDRAVSWLPFYHDMGLVGLLLGPVASQRSVDYLSARDFAARPGQWLKLISRNRGTISFSPPVGYWLSPRRLREGDLEELDLSSWRVAGVGAEIIRLEVIRNFAERLAPYGFDESAFLPCYGLAESSLAVTFSELGGGARAEYLDAERMAGEGVAALAGPDTERVSEVVSCGKILPDHEIEIRDDDGQDLGSRRIGRVSLRGPSVMSGYFQNPSASEEVLSGDGWLDTGDLGYVTEEGLFITGRRKDLIIINGRNIWPQDLELLAEELSGGRIGDASAFSVPDETGMERAVLVVHCRTSDPAERERLVIEVQGAVYRGFGIQCTVDLVPPNTLPKTSSGKLSRAEARRGYLERAELHHGVAAGAEADS